MLRACLTALALAAGEPDAGQRSDPAGGPETLYVQASGLNVRAEPRAAGRLLGQAPIATACAVRERTADGWARLRCGALEGYARLELLGPAAPQAAPNLAKARDAALSARERLNFALRAAALEPDDAAARGLLGELFWLAELENLGEARKSKRKARAPPPAFTGRCEARLEECLPNLGIADPDYGGAPPWRAFKVVGSDLVAAWTHPTFGDLFVASGALTWNEAHDTVTFTAENRYHSPAAPALYQALTGAEPEEGKPSVEQFAGSKRLLARLPSRWFELRGGPREHRAPYVLTFCGENAGISLKPADEPGLIGKVQMNMVMDSADYPIEWIEQADETHYVFHLDHGDGLTLEYPMREEPAPGAKQGFWGSARLGTMSRGAILGPMVPGTYLAKVPRESDCEGP